MKFKKFVKRYLLVTLGLLCVSSIIVLAIKYLPKESNIKYLPTETILVKEIQSSIETNISNALLNIIDRSDFELAIHVNLNQEEITEEQIRYKPKEVSTSQLTKNLTPIPKVNTLPGLIDNPFHNESLPGFPSYFDQFEIEKDDYITRGMFAKILATAYQLPKEASDLNLEYQNTEIIDNTETEFGESISTVVNQDILKLYQSGEFRPNDFLSKASLIVALVRINYPTSNYYSQDVISELPYKDIPRNYWVYNYVKVALENKLIEEDILFNPNKKVTVEDALNLIEKTPLRSDIFNYYKFPKKETGDIFRTDNKKEITESSIYYNQEKTLFKTPTTKIKNISIRLLVNEVVLTDELNLENIEDIVLNVVEMKPERNDSLTVKSYRFTNLPLIIRVYKWRYWQYIYALILVYILGIFVYKGYKRYLNYKANKEKIKQLQQDKEDKLSKILKEQELKEFKKMKQEIIDEAVNNTEGFTLKLEKWLEMLQAQPQYQENKKPTYEKVSILILFVDFEHPGLSSKIIKLIRSNHIKDTIDTIENISKINFEKTRMNIIEFYENFMSPETLFGGKTTSNHIINSAFNEKEKRAIFDIDSAEPFGFLDHVKTTKIIEFLISENEVVAAFILNKCNQEKILEITKDLPSDKLKAIAKHLVHIRNNPCDVMDKFEDEIKDKLFIGEKSEQSKNKIQIQKASSVFETLPKNVRLSIFSDLETNDPETLEQIKAEMFVFEDIGILNDADLQTLIFEVRDMEIIATALKTTSGQLVNRFKENFSERFSSQFYRAQETIKNATEEDIEGAQQDIIRTLRELEKNNRISNLKELKRSQT